jgi:glycerol-3-phosphate acyltransferase PlsY
VQLLLLIVGYLCGSVPSGVLLARRAGVDPRAAGSGNIGATNVARTAGPGLGVMTLVADVLKGALPVLAARALTEGPTLAAAVGVAAFLGHLFPVTLGFAGGKGVATALGVLLALAPLAAGAAAAVFVVVVALTRYVSLASVLAALAAPLLIGLFAYPTPLLVASLVMTALIALRHGENFRRLRAGIEPRLALHKK